MKGIVIINTAVFAPVYKEIALKLQAEGHDIIIVTDSYFSIDKYGLDETQFSVYNFADFNESDIEFLEYDKWNVHSDFDRDNYYHSIRYTKENLWGKVSNSLYVFFSYVFEKEQPDYIFYENVSNGLAHSASIIAEKYNIRYLGLTASRLPGMALLSSTDDKLALQIEEAMKASNELSLDEMEFVKNYILNIEKIQPDYMKNNGLSSLNFMSKIFKKRDLRFIVKTIRYGVFNRENSFQIGNPLIKTFFMNLREVKRWFCAKSINRYYSEDFHSKEYYLYPLHYHPESSTSILAKYYDEFNLIKNIAFSLPHGKYLVVKDHISATGYEKRKFYRDISRLPNVYLARPELNSKMLIKEAIGVFTLTSTVGYEAVLMNKPVAVFGDVFYMRHPLVFNVKGYRDIDEARIFLDGNRQENVLEYNLNYVAAYRSLCFPLALHYDMATAQLLVNEVCDKIKNEMSQ